MSSLIPYFDFKEEKMEFYVRYDLISDFNERPKDKGVEEVV